MFDFSSVFSHNGITIREAKASSRFRADPDSATSRPSNGHEGKFPQKSPGIFIPTSLFSDGLYGYPSTGVIASDSA